MSERTEQPVDRRGALRAFLGLSSAAAAIGLTAGGAAASDAEADRAGAVKPEILDVERLMPDSIEASELARVEAVLREKARTVLSVMGGGTAAKPALDEVDAAIGAVVGKLGRGEISALQARKAAMTALLDFSEKLDDSVRKS